MASDLLEAMQRLRVDTNIDDLLFQTRPRKKARHGDEKGKLDEDVKLQLEADYLLPPKALAQEWPNRLQR